MLYTKGLLKDMGSQDVRQAMLELGLGCKKGGCSSENAPGGATASKVGGQKHQVTPLSEVTHPGSLTQWKGMTRKVFGPSQASFLVTLTSRRPMAKGGMRATITITLLPSKGDS